MGIDQIGFDTSIVNARENAVFMVERTATARAWSSIQLDTALADVEDVYDEVNSLSGVWDAYTTWDFTANTLQIQVRTFWDRLRTLAESWTGPGSDELVDAFAAGMETATTVAENDVGTPFDIADTYIVSPIVQTVQDVHEVATDKRVWVAAGVAAALILVLAIRR